MHQYFSSELQYVADAIVQTRLYWDAIDVKSKEEAAALPDDVIELLAETYDELLEEPGFRELRAVIKTLSKSNSDAEREIAAVMGRFRDLLITLWNANVEPFAIRKKTAQEISELSMAGGDWLAISDDLRYLQNVAEHYWRYGSTNHYDGPPRQYLSDRDMRVLQSVAKTINREGHVRRIQECQTADAFKNRAYDKLQLLLELLDQLGLLK